MPKRYDLEVYRPGSVETVVLKYSSSSPFAAIEKGHLIDLMTNKHAYEVAGIKRGHGLRVVLVTHHFGHIEGGAETVQYTNVYTEDSGMLTPESMGLGH